VASSITVAFLAAGALAFSAGCDKRSEEEEEKERTQYSQVIANEVIKDIFYIKDPRTNTCFASFPAHLYRGVTTVPCEAIPPQLLTVGEVNSSR